MSSVAACERRASLVSLFQERLAIGALVCQHRACGLGTPSKQLRFCSVNAAQLDLFVDEGIPEGLSRADNFISPSQERDCVAALKGLPFEAFEFHGFLGKRRVISFGWRYDFSSGRLHPAAEKPPFLLALRDHAAAFAGVKAEDLAHALITEYAPGAAIGWHRDKAKFDVVIGLSLLAPCQLRFRRKLEKGFERTSLIVEPRSIYVLRGAARSEWEHSIPPVSALRYSITFRTLR